MQKYIKLSTYYSTKKQSIKLQNYKTLWRKERILLIVRDNLKRNRKGTQATRSEIVYTLPYRRARLV